MVPDRERPYFKAREVGESSTGSVAEHVHARGVQTAFTLDNALLAQMMHLPYSQGEAVLKEFGIDPKTLSVDFVSGFSHVMNSWTAEVAAASLTNPQTLPIPHFPKDSLLAASHPSLCEELSLEAADGVRNGINAADAVKEYLEHDPTGLHYMQSRLQEEQDRPLSRTRNAELHGMTTALKAVETMYKQMSSLSSKKLSH